MSFLNTLTLSEYSNANPQNPIAIKRRKLANKIDEQARMASDSTYQPKKRMWRANEAGGEVQYEVPKRVKRWWVEQPDGSVLLTVRYGSKALELAKGKNAIHLASRIQLVETLQGLKQAVMQGELDEQLRRVTAFGRNIKRNSKAT